MIKTIIVDDERLARSELKSQLEKFKEIEIVDECSNGKEAIEKIESQKPDLVFLDIHMPGLDGFDVLEELTFTTEVIFVTAYDQHAIKAFDINALDYILKPIQEERLQSAVEKMIKRFQEASSQQESKSLHVNDKVFIKDGEKCWFVELNKISLFESEGNYVRIHFKGNKPLVLKSLNNLEKRLDSSVFFRANRRFIINLDYIDKIDTWFGGRLKVILSTGAEIEISRRQAAKLKDDLSL